MKQFYYQNITTNEMVYEEDWQDYAINQLGITIEPKGQAGSYTTDQLDFIKEFTDWYFSGNWVLKIEQEDDGDIFEIINESCNLEKGWAI